MSAVARVQTSQENPSAEAAEVDGERRDRACKRHPDRFGDCGVLRLPEPVRAPAAGHFLTDLPGYRYPVHERLSGRQRDEGILRGSLHLLIDLAKRISRSDYEAGAGGATETPRTACLSIVLATSPEAFASSANSRRYLAPEGRPCGVPIDCCTAEKRPSSTRDPGSFSASITRRGLSPARTSSLSFTNSS